jgi:hypothetical protein
MGRGDLQGAYANNRNQQNLVAVEENIIGSVFVKFYRDYETKISNLTFVGSPELLHRDPGSREETPLICRTIQGVRDEDTTGNIPNLLRQSSKEGVLERKPRRTSQTKMV